MSDEEFIDLIREGAKLDNIIHDYEALLVKLDKMVEDLDRQVAEEREKMEGYKDDLQGN